MQIGVVMSGCRPGGGGELLTVRTIESLSEAGHSITLYVPEAVNLDEYSRFYNDAFRCRIVVRKNRIINLIPQKYRTLPKDFYLKWRLEEKIIFDLSPTVIPTYIRLPDLAYFHALPLLDPLRPKRFRRSANPKHLARKLFIAAWKKNVDRFLTSSTKMLANSDFTRRELCKVGLHCEVAYPPVDLISWQPQNDTYRKGVVSVARFSPSNANKHHEWQLQILKDKPTTLLALGGCMTLEETHHLKWLKQNATPNVKLVANAPFQQVRDAVWSAKVFLHTAEKEGFGMSVVEAIAAGCIPLVYDDGGPREIVTVPELRFKSIEEARVKLDKALAGEYDGLLPELQNHVQSFDVKSYKKRFLDLVSDILN